jgi:uncharacterized membrane protein
MLRLLRYIFCRMWNDMAVMRSLHLIYGIIIIIIIIIIIVTNEVLTSHVEFCIALRHIYMYIFCMKRC